MLNNRQLDIAEKILVNSANVILASLVLGNFLNPHGFSWVMLFAGCLLFSVIVWYTIWLRRDN